MSRANEYQFTKEMLAKAAAGGPNDTDTINIAKINASAEKKGFGKQLAMDFIRATWKIEIHTHSEIREEEVISNIAGSPSSSPNTADITAYTPEEVVTQLKNKAVKIKNSPAFSFHPEAKWLDGIDLIAKYHDQAFIGYGTTLINAYFPNLIKTLSEAPAYLLKTNRKKTISLIYDSEQACWFYEVTASLLLKDTFTGSETKASNVTHRLKVTSSGFELASVEYSNPAITNTFNYHTQHDETKLLLRLTASSEPEIQEEKFKKLLEHQGFPFHMWHSYFLTALKKNITAPLRFKKYLNEKQPKSSLAVFMEAGKETEKSDDLKTAFLQAVFQTYASLPNANPKALFVQILNTETTKNIDQPFCIKTKGKADFILYTRKETKEILDTLMKAKVDLISEKKLAEAKTRRRGMFFRPSNIENNIKDNEIAKAQQKLHTKFYETQKEHIAGVLPYFEREDAINLLDDLFFIRETLQIKDQSMLIEWPIVTIDPRASREEKFLQEIIKDVKKALFSKIFEALTKKESLPESLCEEYNAAFMNAGKASSPHFYTIK